MFDQIHSCIQTHKQNYAFQSKRISNSDLDKSGDGIHFIHTKGEHESHNIPTGKFSSNYMCEHIAIKRALYIYHISAIESSCGILMFTESRSVLKEILRGNSQLTQEIIVLVNRTVAVQSVCTLQQIPIHVDILGNEQADNLTKKVRNSPQLSSNLTLIDADAIARRKLTSQPPKKNSIPNVNWNRVISNFNYHSQIKHRTL